MWPRGRGHWIYICSLIGRNPLALHSLFGFKYSKAPERETDRERERERERVREGGKGRDKDRGREREGREKERVVCW